MSTDRADGSAGRLRRLNGEGGRKSNRQKAVEASADRLALLSIYDIGVFFAVLLVGFAYVWRRATWTGSAPSARERAVGGNASAAVERGAVFDR